MDRIESRSPSTAARTINLELTRSLRLGLGRLIASSRSYPNHVLPGRIPRGASPAPMQMTSNCSAMATNLECHSVPSADKAGGLETTGCQRVAPRRAASGKERAWPRTPRCSAQARLAGLSWKKLI